MKSIIRFSRLFLPAAIFSAVLVIAGIAGYIAKGGFNLGVDFQAGLIQEVQFAPAAFSATWAGEGNAVISFDRGNIHIVNSGIGMENRTYSFSFNEYRTLGSLAQAMNSRLEGLNVQLKARQDVNSQWILFSTQGNPYLGSAPYVVHFLDPQSQPISIASVREAMISLGQAASVQSLGQPSDRQFMIRVEDKEEGRVRAEQITGVLENYFGKDEVAVLRSDYVGSRFSKNLTDQAGILLTLTLLLMLVYMTFRFKVQYAVGAIIGIIHDGIVIVAFVVWTRMEFNTTTIAAILTILGYSSNNTIVVFDRIRENLRIFPNEPFITVLNRSLTGTLGRTIITTATTMLAVLSLFIFTTGSMKDFALALLVGMTSGVYTTLFIASGFVYIWESKKVNKEKRRLTLKTAGAKA